MDLAATLRGVGWGVSAAEFVPGKDRVSLKDGRTPIPAWTVARRVEHEISGRESAVLLDALRRTEFWSTPEWKDGTQWILEGRVGTKHRVVSRLSVEANPFHPNPDERLPPLREVFRLFFDVAGLNCPGALN